MYIGCGHRPVNADMFPGLQKYNQLSPCGQPDSIDSSQIRGKNKSRMFDWNKLPRLRALAIEGTKSRSLRCPL